MRLRSFRCWFTLTSLVMVAAMLSGSSAIASNGEEDGLNPPPDRSQFEGHGNNKESSRLKRASPTPDGDQGELGEHMDQNRINDGQASFDELFQHGAHLFQAQFNKADGQGRPLHTSGGVTRTRVDEDFVRTSGPDSSSCWQCHNLPRSGGGGDFNALMFSGLHGQTLPGQSTVSPLETFFNTSPTLTNQRAGPSVFGGGAQEMLAREMSFELASIRSAAMAEAGLGTAPNTVQKDLVAKGISFGKISAVHNPQGVVKIDPSLIVGVDWDLIIKPHTLKGTGVSLRGFSTGGNALHMGMQAVERFGVGDTDGDGVAGELSIGDVTALTVWMAALPVPGRVFTKDKGKQAAIVRGEELFTQIGCASCHTPAMYLDNPVYSEPSPFHENATGLLKVSQLAAQGKQPFKFDLTRDGPGPRPERTKDGRAIIRAFTDLKRHNILDSADAGRLSTEQIQGGSIRGQVVPGVTYTITPGVLAKNVFLTEKLWDVGSTAPYGHRGDLSTLGRAIQAHGGEAASERAAFNGLNDLDKACLIDFLKSLQIVPVDAPRITHQGDAVR